MLHLMNVQFLCSIKGFSTIVSENWRGGPDPQMSPDALIVTSHIIELSPVILSLGEITLK